MNAHTGYVVVGAVVVAALAWVDPIFIPLVTLGPLASGLVAGALGASPRSVAAVWLCGGLLMLVSDLVVNGEDVLFHAVVALVTAALGAGSAALGRRLHRRGAEALRPAPDQR